MQHYLYLNDANHFNGIGVKPGDHDLIDVHFTDQAVLQAWTPVVVHGMKENPGQEGDFPTLTNYGTLPVMSQGAWNALRPLIGYCCEALPIIHPTGESYFIIHVMDTIDCLDYGKSEVVRNRSSGRVSKVYKYSFKNEMLSGKHIFKLPLESGADLLVDNEFRRLVEVHGLRGLLFEEIPLATGNDNEQLPKVKPLKSPPRPRTFPKTTERSLSPEDEYAVQEQIIHAMNTLRIKAASATPDKMQQKIYKEINRIRNEPVSLDKTSLENAAMALGCLWGTCVCDRLGWHWASITIGDQEAVGIVAPLRELVVFPMQFVQKLLSDPKRDQTSLLLYNMLVGGQPEAEEGSYSAIG